MGFQREVPAIFCKTGGRVDVSMRGQVAFHLAQVFCNDSWCDPADAAWSPESWGVQSADCTETRRVQKCIGASTDHSPDLMLSRNQGRRNCASDTDSVDRRERARCN